MSDRFSTVRRCLQQAEINLDSAHRVPGVSLKLQKLSQVFDALRVADMALDSDECCERLGWYGPPTTSEGE